MEKVRELPDLMKLVCLFVSQNCSKKVFYLSFWGEKKLLGVQNENKQIVIFPLLVCRELLTAETKESFLTVGWC